MKIYEDVFTGKYTSHGLVIPLIPWLIIVAEMNKIFIDIFRSYDMIKKNYHLTNCIRAKYCIENIL